MKEILLSTDELRKLIPQILTIASDAGDAIIEVYRKEITVNYKEDRSPITEADLHSSEILMAGLQKLTPRIPVICEETAEMTYDYRKQYKQIWIVDPLDGTKEFIAKNDEFAINIALVENHYPILGIIYAPVTRMCYYAIKGMGAYKLVLGDEPRLLSPKVPNIHQDGITIAVSRSHLSAEDTNYIEKLKGKCGQVRTLPYGSSLKFGLMAEGNADVYPKFGYTMEWDTASGQIILEESGAEILSADTGSPLQYNKENTRNPYFIAKRKKLFP